MVEALIELPSVAAAIETKDEAVWKESIDLLEIVGGSLTVSWPLSVG